MNIYLYEIDSPDWHTVGLILGVLLVAGSFFALGGIFGLGRGYREGMKDGEAVGERKNAELVTKLERLGLLAQTLQVKLNQSEHPDYGADADVAEPVTVPVPGAGLAESVREASQAPDARSYDGTAAGTRVEDELPALDDGYQPDERVGKVIGALRYDFMPSSGDVIPIPPYLHEPKAGHHIVIYVGDRSTRFLLGEPFFRQSGDRKVLSAGITEVGGSIQHPALVVYNARDARIADVDKTLADHAASPAEPGGRPDWVESVDEADTERAEPDEEPKQYQYYMSTGIPVAEQAQTERVEDPAKPGVGGLDRPRFDRT